MALSLKQLTNIEKVFENRSSTESALKSIIERQMQALLSTSSDTPAFNGSAHYTAEVAGIEHICRLLWGATPGGEAIAKHHQDILKLICEGCNPKSENYWNKPSDYDQRVVEMASIAVAIVDAQNHYWQPLSVQEKQCVEDWLLNVKDLELPPNNWRWFRILILTALDIVGATTDQQVIRDDLAFIEDLHYADGWYHDGKDGAIDYYNPFAFQLYALIFVRWTNSFRSEDAKAHQHHKIGERLLKKAIEFSESYQYWFAEDGKPLCYGRSLNYRFAGAAFWAELARCEHPNVDISLARTCWQRTMQWWSEQPIWDSNAQLLPGFAYPNLLTSEFYTSYASPMLALKAFNALSLSDDHPFWTTELKPLEACADPVFIGQHHQILRQSGTYLITNAPASNELRGCEDKYSKFAYSSDHGFCVESSRWIEQGWAGDNILAFRHPETKQWFSRSENLESYCQDDALVSVWSPFSGCQVKTTQWFLKGYEFRLHEVTTDKPLDYLMTGYAVDSWKAWFSHLESQAARVESSTLFSELNLLKGKGDTRVYPCAPNTNLMYSHASVPAITGRLNVGESSLLVEVNAGKLTP